MPTSTLPENGRPAPEKSRMSPRSVLLWTAVALLGAVAWGVLALARGEEISAVWLVIAALGSYAIAYRFYSRFIARRVLRPDDSRTASTSTPPTAVSSSATTSPPSPAPAPWSARSSRPRWAICPARCGSSPE